MTDKKLNEIMLKIDSLYKKVGNDSKARNWLWENYYNLGEGSSRAVFALDAKHAIKLATNEKGIAQNEAEVQLYEKYCNDKNCRLAKIYWYSTTYKYIIVERCKSINKYFEEKGWNFYDDDVAAVLNDYCDGQECKKLNLVQMEKHARSRMKGDGPKAAMNKIIADMKVVGKFIFKSKISDIYDDQIGYNAKGKLTVLDYGMTKNVYEQFYKHIW